MHSQILDPIVAPRTVKKWRFVTIRAGVKTPMFNYTISTESASLYIKIANSPGLYRHVNSGRYYAAKKINGKRREHSLGTTDRQIAERWQRDWVASLRIVDREVERTNFCTTDYLTRGSKSREISPDADHCKFVYQTASLC